MQLVVADNGWNRLNLNHDMKHDLSQLLHDWPYDPEHTMRIVTAGDGRSVLQVRLPLGIEQYELEGRPDGHEP